MSRDGKIIGYGLLLCAAALTVFLCRALYPIPAAERSIASASAQLGDAGTAVKTAASGFSQTGAKLNAAIGQLGSAAQSMGSASDAVHTQINSIGGEVTRPCKGEAGPDACGLLAQSKKTIIKAGDAVVTAQDAIQRSQKTASASVTAAAKDFDTVATAGTATLTDVNAILNRPDLVGPNGTIANAAVITGNIGGMTGDARHYFHDLIDPPPCRTKMCVVGRAAEQFRESLGFIQPMTAIYSVFRGQKVYGTITTTSSTPAATVSKPLPREEQP